MRVRTHKNYASYFPALVKALEMVGGDILELGSGLHSTIFLHWMCGHQGRSLITYEHDKYWYDLVKHCGDDPHESGFHKVVFVDDWDKIAIEKPWGIVLVDHGPGIRRKEEIRRLADYAQCLVVHDARGRDEKHYRYSEIYPLFKHIQLYGSHLSQAVILSNHIDVTKWDRDD